MTDAVIEKILLANIWTRTDYGYFAAHHVEELRKFINAGAT
jgi:hypothetical protein